MKIKTWTDVDEAVKQIGLLSIRRDRIEGRMNVAITKAKEQAAVELVPVDHEIARLTDRLQAFCDDHRAEMDQAKKNGGLAKRGPFGKVAFRKCPPAIKLIKAAKKVLAALQARKLTACIRTVQDPDLAAMHALPDAVLAEVGARRQPGEQFEVKPDYQAIPNQGEAA